MVAHKIEVGQCYEYLDHVWMVMCDGKHDTKKKKYYCVEETLTKQTSTMSEVTLRSLRRPFQNFG